MKTSPTRHSQNGVAKAVSPFVYSVQRGVVSPLIHVNAPRRHAPILATHYLSAAELMKIEEV
jgi:hypothetical protein